ncbi:MAG: hypothetical protein WB586_07980 [Chthoniobacterales bacterium]
MPLKKYLSSPARITYETRSILAEMCLFFFAAALLLGSASGLFVTAIHLPLVDLFIRRQEEQLEKGFCEQWMRNKKQVRRWV